MVTPSLSVHSVAALSIGGLKIDQALLFILRCLIPYRNYNSTSTHNVVIITAIVIGITYLERKYKWTICGQKISSWVPDLKINIVVLEKLHAGVKKYVWVYTVLCWTCYVQRRQC